MLEKAKRFLKNGGGKLICVGAALIIVGAALATFSNL